MSAKRDFDFEIKNIEEVVAEKQRKFDFAKEQLASARQSLAKLHQEKQASFEKNHSGTRVEEVTSYGNIVFLVARGHYLDSKYFTFYTDGRPGWAKHPHFATAFKTHEQAEAEIVEIKKADREYRAERKDKKKCSHV